MIRQYPNKPSKKYRHMLTDAERGYRGDSRHRREMQYLKAVWMPIRAEMAWEKRIMVR